MDLMRQFFMPTLEKIKQVDKIIAPTNVMPNVFQHVNAVFAEPDVENLTHLFLVGGFAESTLLQVSSLITLTIHCYFTSQRTFSAPSSPIWSPW